MNRRIDKGEFEKEPIVTAHPYKNGFMVFTAKGIYQIAPEKTKKQRKK